MRNVWWIKKIVLSLTYKLKTNIMRKLLLLSLVLMSLVSCEIVKETDDDRFNQLEKPIIVVAKSNLETKTKAAESMFYQLEVSASITVKDANGRFITFNGKNGLGASLFCTYNVKDTIK